MDEKLIERQRIVELLKANLEDVDHGAYEPKYLGAKPGVMLPRLIKLQNLIDLIEGKND